MEDSVVKCDHTDEDNIKMYLDLCIPPNQLDFIQVHLTLPNNNILSANFTLWDTILEVKHYILSALQPKIDYTQQIRCFMFDDEHRKFEVNDHAVLKYYWNKCPIKIFVNIKYRGDSENNVPRMLNNISAQYLVRRDHGNVLDTNVTMQKDVIGYKNERTGKLYWNTMVQTAISKTSANLSDNKNKISSAVQTLQTREATTRVIGDDFGTQTETMNVLRSMNCIREITASRNINSRNVTTDEYQDKCARTIQKCMRMWRARKKFENMLRYYYYLKQLVCNEVEDLKKNVYNNQQRNLINLQYPTKTKDFEAIYAVVHNHHKNKKSNIKNKIEKKAQLREKLKCLKEITKHRNQAKETAEEKKILTQLNVISKPIICTIKGSKGSVLIETSEIYEAKQLLEFYITLKRRDLSKIERIEFLLKLKKTLECSEEIDFTQSIINLLNRELTLLNIVKLNDSQLEILRKRIEINFQFIIRQPEINPAIARTPKPTNLIKCFSCRKLKSLSRFKMKLDLTNTTICKDCRHLYCITVKQINLMPYEDIYRTIRATEAKLKTKSNITFFLCTEDIYYLVEIIWKGKSALSEFKDVTQLQLIRWDHKLNWSPSNTILLTIDEAAVHSNISDINKVYTSTFIDNVHLKHVAARNYFKGLSEKAVDCNRKWGLRDYHNK